MYDYISTGAKIYKSFFLTYKTMSGMQEASTILLIYFLFVKKILSLQYNKIVKLFCFFFFLIFYQFFIWCFMHYGLWIWNNH